MILLFAQIPCTVCLMVATGRSAKPLPAILRSILEEQEISQRELTRRCQSRGWGSLRTTTELLSGNLRPTEKAMQALATALQVRPEVFVEYRLLKMRQLLDPDAVGFKKAVKNLERFDLIQRAEGSEPKPSRPKTVKNPRAGRGGRGGSA